MHFVIHYIDQPDGKTKRAEFRSEHIAYRKSLGNQLILAGPLLDTDQHTPIGSMIIAEAENNAAARKLANNDPYIDTGVTRIESVTAYRIMLINPPVR